jgi:hypothetical protein
VSRSRSSNDPRQCAGVLERLGEFFGERALRPLMTLVRPFMFFSTPLATAIPIWRWLCGWCHGLCPDRRRGARCSVWYSCVRCVRDRRGMCDVWLWGGLGWAGLRPRFRRLSLISSQ